MKVYGRARITSKRQKKHAAKKVGPIPAVFSDNQSMPVSNPQPSIQINGYYDDDDSSSHTRCMYVVCVNNV